MALLFPCLSTSPEIEKPCAHARYTRHSLVHGIRAAIPCAVVLVVSLEGAASSGNLGVSFEQKIIMMESGTEK
jgi:hypothetical protein